MLLLASGATRRRTQAYSDRPRGARRFFRVLALAASIGREHRDTIDISFSSLLLACIESEDPLSVWLKGYREGSGADIEPLLSRCRVDADTLAKIPKDKAARTPS